MADPRVTKFANVLVEHSARVVPGDRILLEGTTAAEPLLRELYIQILEKGGQPHLMMALPGLMPFSQEEMYLTYAKDTQLDLYPLFINWRMTSSRDASAFTLQRTHMAPQILTPQKFSDTTRRFRSSPKRNSAAAGKGHSSGSPPSSPPTATHRMRT